MARVILTAHERRELEQALSRLETEHRLLTDALSRDTAQGSAPPDTLQWRETLDSAALVDGRIRQVRRWRQQDCFQPAPRG